MDINSLTLKLLIHYSNYFRELLSPFKPLFSFGFKLTLAILVLMVLFQGLVYLKALIKAVVFNINFSIREFPSLSIFLFICFLMTLFGFLNILV